MQGQREQHTISAFDEVHFGGGIELRRNVPMTQRHALGRTGCSRGIKEHCFIVPTYRRKFCLFVLKEPFPIRLRRILFASIEQDEFWFFFEIKLLDPLRSLSCRNDRARLTVLQNVNQSFLAKLDIERHSDHASANDSQRSRDPLRAVFGEEGHGIAAFKILPDEPIGESSRASCKFLKRPTMSIFLVEIDQRRLVATLA